MRECVFVFSPAGPAFRFADIGDLPDTRWDVLSPKSDCWKSGVRTLTWYGESPKSGRGSGGFPPNLRNTGQDGKSTLGGGWSLSFQAERNAPDPTQLVRKRTSMTRVENRQAACFFERGRESFQVVVSISPVDRY